MNIHTLIDPVPDVRPMAKWFRRLTVVGFAFFLVKGLFWVALVVWVMA